jgi:HKD family nuclease
VLIPSEPYPNALAALEATVADGAAVRSAVAFVTVSGVRHLASVLNRGRETSLEITARAADATEPDALLMLRDDLGADVSIVIGQHSRSFHPKLWIIDRLDKTVVLSGSGNLTGGGLVINDEQFEVIEYAADDDVRAQHECFDHLIRYSQIDTPFIAFQSGTHRGGACDRSRPNANARLVASSPTLCGR